MITKKEDHNRCALQIVVIKMHTCTEGSLSGGILANGVTFGTEIRRCI